MPEMSVADIAAVTDKRGYGYGDGYNSWIWVILLFFLWGGYGNRGYGLENALTRSDLQQGFDNQSVLRKLDGITNGLSDGFYAVNTNNLQMQNQLQRDLCQGFASTNASIAENRFAQQNCCCETNRNIDSVRFEGARNTCDIVRAIEKDGEATRALINANTMQALRDKLVEKDQQIQTREFQLSQVNQNSTIINAIRPFPVPAYPTCSPYTAYNGYGCNGFA